MEPGNRSRSKAIAARFFIGLAAILLLAVPSLAQEAGAGEVTDSAEPPPKEKISISGTLATLVEDNRTRELDGEEDGDYQKYKGLLSLNLGWKMLSAGVQLEYLYYSDPELAIPGDLDRVRDGFSLRKYWLDYVSDRFKGRLGTFFTSFGYGMTLYVQKNEVVGLDEPIHGIDLDGELGPFEFEALGGNVTDPLLEDAFNRQFEDTIWGARALVNLPKETYLSASYVEAELESLFPAQDKDQVDVWSVGAGGYELGGVLDLHGEWAQIDKVERGRAEDGYGGYLSAAASFGLVTILGEYKDYWNFDYRYNNPPTCGPSTESYAFSDVKGPRLLVSGNILATGTLITGSYGDFDSHRKEDSLGGLDGDGQVEWNVAIEETVGPVYLEADYFHRDWTNREITEEHVVSNLHVTTLGGRGDVAVGYDLRKESSNYAARADHRSYLSFSMSPWGSVGVRYAWTDKTNVPKEEFWGGEIQYLPSRAITLTLFVGSDPGGLVCAGGQCREQPPFKGFWTTLNWRF